MSYTSCMGAKNSGFPHEDILSLFFLKQPFKHDVFQQINIRANSLDPPLYLCKQTHSYKHMHGCLCTRTLKSSDRDIVAVTKETQHNRFSSVSLTEPQYKQSAVSVMMSGLRRRRGGDWVSYLWTSSEGCWGPPRQAGRHSDHPPN